MGKEEIEIMSVKPIDCIIRLIYILIQDYPGI